MVSNFSLLIFSTFLFSLLFLSGCIQWQPNPAIDYCEKKGFTTGIRVKKDGTQIVYCDLGGGLECEVWEFYRGECPSCEDWCLTQPHILCEGYWNISGTYPNCRCYYVCSTSE